MAHKRKPTKIDPELTRQLDAADVDDKPVQAVVYFRSGGGRGPEAVTKVADSVIESATRKAGTAPSRVNVMRYIGTMAVEAPASWVRALIDETEIESALANVHPGDEDAGIGVPTAPPSERAIGSKRATGTAADDAADDTERAPGTERTPGTAKTADAERAPDAERTADTETDRPD